MKSAPSSVLTSTSVATCWKTVLSDGTTYGFTDHNENITYDSLTYKSLPGVYGSASESTLGDSSGGSDMYGFFSSSDITNEAIEAGLWDGARVYKFQIDWSDTSAGIIKLDAGFIGEIVRTPVGFTATTYDLFKLIDQTIGAALTTSCNHVLGDSGCGITLEPDAWQANTAYALLDVVVMTTNTNVEVRFVCVSAGTSDVTEPTWDETEGNSTNDNDVIWTAYRAYTFETSVSAVTNNYTFDVHGDLTLVENELTYGWVEFTSGLNSGMSLQVKSNTAAGEIELVYPAPFTVAVSDTFKVVRGCNKMAKLESDVWLQPYTGDCRAKFSPETLGNVVNFGGFPEITGPDRVFGQA